MKRQVRLLSGAGAALVIGRSQGFLGGSLPGLSTTSKSAAHQPRCRIVRLALTPPPEPTGAAAAAGGEDNRKTSTRRITRAPLRITPNFQPQEKRRPKTEVHRDITYGAFLTEESFDIAAMAWEEFSDFLRRTIERNVNGAQFEFDIRQWSSSIRKWWSRAVEMDVQAKADLFRLYDSSVGQRDTWGNQAAKVDARVEDEWDSIYVDFQEISLDDNASGFGSTNKLEAEDGGYGSRSDGMMAMGRDLRGANIPGSATTAMRAVATTTATGPQPRREGGRWRATNSDIGSTRSGGSRSALMAALDAFNAEDEEDGEDDGKDEEGGAEGKGFDEDEIIDCAIRGRWRFENNDDPPHFSPQQ